MQGRPWDAIVYYQRAVKANSQLPEATCGLISSLNAVCDWRGRGKAAGESFAVDEDGYIREVAGFEGNTYPGWMTKMVATCETQLNLVYSQNLGAIQSARSLKEWLELIEWTIGKQLDGRERANWTASLSPFYQDSANDRKYINEGGFLIRFNEWAERRLQHRWYLLMFGELLESQEKMARPSASDEGASAFLRPTLPSFLGPPPVPSVLPFHTVITFSSSY